MTRLANDVYREYMAFQDHGISLSKKNRVVPHTARETNGHWIAKSLVARVGMKHGYRVDSEVDIHGNDTDILLWGNPDRLTVSVEVESSPTGDVQSEKLEKYVHSNPCVQDMYLINASELPMDRVEAEEWIANEMGLSV